jgi:hypothetical protein
MLFKKREIKIVFKTFDPFVLKNLAPSQRKNKHPDWFKNTPPFQEGGSVSSNFDSIPAPTIRRCPALNDYFSTGVTVPNWTDLEFFVDGPKRSIEWRYSNDYQSMELVQPHDSSQFPTLSKKYMHAKIISPWIAECNSDINWLLTKPSYFSEFDDQDVIFCDGVVQFYNNFVTNVNLFFPIRDSSYTVKFTAGEPFQKYIALTEQPINIATEYCTQEYYDLAAMKGRKISYHLGTLYNIFKRNNRKEKDNGNKKS